MLQITLCGILCFSLVFKINVDEDIVASISDILDPEGENGRVRNRTSAAEIFLRKVFNNCKFHFNAVSASLRIFF